MANSYTFSYPATTYQPSRFSVEYPVSIGCSLAFVLNHYKLTYLHCSYPLPTTNHLF
ncbi:MAG: hypothetical protein V4714_01980 [Bacteroidota bacterium]